MYESPHRIIKTLEQIAEFIDPTRPLMLAREISKLHEQMHRGSAEELLAYFNQHPDKVRGEMVLVISGKNK